MDLRHLAYLVALHREEHFGRAARACHVSQPTLSSGIRRLETEVGFPIVRRSQRYEGLLQVFEGSGKPAPVVEKIVEGKLGAFYGQAVLLDQPSVRDPAVTVSQLVAQASAKTGENITVGRFARFKIGELSAD